MLSGLSEADELRLDRARSPLQFSKDLGPIQQRDVNEYVSSVYLRLLRYTHRHLPYSVRVVNAHELNAYTFPAGSCALTRSLLIELSNEAELAFVLGHELAHVNHRHVAQKAGRGVVATVALVGLAIATAKEDWGPLAQSFAQLGATALLAAYSREDEREADELGLRYVVEAGYPPQGGPSSFAVLLRNQREQPSLLDTLFATHPMSKERIDSTRALVETRFATSKNLPHNRERFMDRTASLRSNRDCILACRNGEIAMRQRRLNDSLISFERAVRLNKDDYAARIRLGQALMISGRAFEALQQAQAAQAIYPNEAQGHKLAAVLALRVGLADQALSTLHAYKRTLPEDTGVEFLLGFTHERLGDRRRAAQHYLQYLSTGEQGRARDHATQRLREWRFL